MEPETRSVIYSGVDFSIYTDDNSPEKQANARFSGSSLEDSENLPPKLGAAAAPALLPSVQHGEHANQCFAERVPAVPIQGQFQLEDKTRYVVTFIAFSTCYIKFSPHFVFYP